VIRRVLIALHEEVLGGATLSVLRCAPLLEQRGWELTYWAPRPGEVFDQLAARGRDVAGAERLLASSLDVLRLPPGPAQRLRATPGYLRAFRSHVRATGADLVHANSLVTIAEGAAARSAGARVVMHLHEMAPAGRKGAAAARLAHRIADEVVAVSRSCARSWTVGGAEPRVVYEGCRIPTEPPRLPEGSPPVVGTVGVIARRKGMDIFCDAAEELRRRDGNVELRIVGSPTDPLDAEWGHDVLARAERLGIRHLPRADVPHELASWHGFALASRQDPFPISMLEAMAHGRPVIGTRVDGIAEQVTPEVGVLVEPENGVALADAILALAEMPGERRREMGAAAHSRAGEFSIERQAAAIDAVWREVLER
jgi:glycosyltransferase involved in cell wall biosynthesis